MALPKEPRQKMINIMYLVLTALLALNVSSEILNAFKTVDRSLLNSNTVIDKANTNITNSMNEMTKDPNTREKAMLWKPKADSAVAITAQMSAYIDELKQRLLQEADVNENGEYKEDNLEAATRMMVEGKVGDTLLERLKSFEQEVVSVLPQNQREAMIASFPIDLEVPPSNNEGNKTWSAAYFRMTPAVAAMTLLSKFQNDVKRSGNLVAAKCLEQVGQVVVRFNKFEPLVSQNSEYLLPGQPLVVTAGLGAFNTENLPSVTINGSPRPVDPATGTAKFETNVSGGGEQSVRVNVTYTDPNDGQKKTIEKTINYTVGTPSEASIFLEKMNVVYLGVDNPIRVSSGSGKAETMRVSFSGGGLSGSGGKYVIKPMGQPGPATLTVAVENKSATFPIRVKRLPDPVALLGQSKGGKIPSAQFKAIGGLRAQLENSDFEAPFAVISYTMAGSGPGFDNYTPVQVSSARWPAGNAVESRAKPGSIIYFDDILVRGPDGQTRKLPGIGFALQ